MVGKRATRRGLQRAGWGEGREGRREKGREGGRKGGTKEEHHTWYDGYPILTPSVPVSEGGGQLVAACGEEEEEDEEEEEEETG